MDKKFRIVLSFQRKKFNHRFQNFFIYIKISNIPFYGVACCYKCKKQLNEDCYQELKKKAKIMFKLLKIAFHMIQTLFFAKYINHRLNHIKIYYFQLRLKYHFIIYAW